MTKNTEISVKKTAKKPWPLEGVFASKFRRFGEVYRESLSDGSPVFSIIIGAEKFDCLSEDKAVACLHQIAAALRGAVINPDSIVT